MKRALRWVLAVFGVLVLCAWLGFIMASTGLREDPEDIEWRLTPAAQHLVEEAYADIAPGSFRDLHTHVVTVGTTGTGGYVSDRLLTWRHPVERIRTAFYMRAAGVDNIAVADTHFLARLVRLARALPDPGRHYLLAMDQFHAVEGHAQRSLTEFHIPNNYVFALHEQYPELFDAVISIHPYRADAVQELEQWAKQGARMVKWIPNLQGMDPADPRLDAFYDVMAKYRMVLLTHVGKEQAVPTHDAYQHLGNPLRLRRALDHGVKVVAAHCASLGRDEDLDNPGRGEKPSYELFLRLMGEPRYDGLLFGEISALTFVNRAEMPLKTILQRRDIHHRLVYGSDYPLPAINVLISLARLRKYGLVDGADVGPLRELYAFNPLLFDYVLARRLRDPETGQRLPASVFMANEALGLEQAAPRVAEEPKAEEATPPAASEPEPAPAEDSEVQ